MVDKSRTKTRQARTMDVAEDAPKDEGGVESLTFIANLCDRQSALMLSGSGDRCLIELEAFGVNATIALVGMAKFTRRGFRITIEELPKNWTELDNEVKSGSKGTRIKVGRGRVKLD